MKSIKKTVEDGSKGKGKFPLVLAAILLALIILIGAVSRVILYIKRDYRKEGREEYLESVETGTSELPSIVLIYVDDMGYGDLSITGSEAISTPNIDSLAEEGVLLTNYYAPAPICSASRAGLLSGRYPIRTLTTGAYMDTPGISGHISNLIEYVKGTYKYGNTGLPTDEILLPEILQEAGYDTALVGKWHLGIQKDEFPTERGFDYFYGALYSDDNDPYRVYENDTVIYDDLDDQSNLTKELTEVATDYIRENSENPFFLYYASPFPHYPSAASEEFTGSSLAGTYGDCVQEIDWSVGEILDTLEECGLTDNTLVIFTSDNGPWYEGATGGSRGRKDTNYNGGSHVPFIAYMPGRIEGGQTMDGLMSGVDIYSTILDLIGVEEPEDRIIDGVSMLAYLTGQESDSPRTTIYTNKDENCYALIENNFKYVERSYSENGTYWMLQQGPYLYDLSVDAEEAYDVTSLYPSVAEEMAEKLKDYEQSLKENPRGWLDE